MKSGVLSDPQIRAIKATGKRFEIIDGHGLYLDVTPTGGKIRRYRYRLHGRREKITLGSYPNVSLAEARTQRLKMGAMVARGKSLARDLARQKQQALIAGTIAELVPLYQADLAARSKDKGKARNWVFDAHILPGLGRFPLGDLSPADILTFLDKIKKTAPASAVAVHGYLRRMFEFAIGRQLVSFNPAAAILPKIIGAKRPRERALSPAEIGTLLRHLDSATGEPSTLYAFRLLLLTMVRRSELLETN